MQIGCIGLGAMGLPIAEHLAARFGSVLACDVRPSPAAQARPGLRWLASAAEVAQASDLVLLCLPGAAASTAAIEGDAGLVAGARPGLTVVDLSTLDPEVVRGFGAALQRMGASYCDAPVFGTPQHAQRGTLAVVMSGPIEASQASRPAIECFARRITHAGPLGAASLIKVMQNSLGLVQIAAIAEAFAVLQAAGGDAHAFYEAVVGSGGMADSALFAKVGIDFADQHARFGARLRIGAKDIALGHHVAQRSGASAPFIEQTAAQFEAAAADGFGEADLLLVSAAIRAAAVSSR